MNQELRELQRSAGATFASSASGIEMPIFGNDAAALRAAREGVAICDRSHWGRIQVAGADRIRFLHNQTTNDFQKLKPQQSCETVFITSTARTIDLATAYIAEDATILLVSPNRREKIMAWLDRYIFPADKVYIEDITDSTGCFSAIGPGSTALLEQLGVSLDWESPAPPENVLPENVLPENSSPENSSPENKPGRHQIVELNGIPVRIATGSGLAAVGYTFIFAIENAAALWQTLTNAGAVCLGEDCWEQLRIQQGRPAPDLELTEDYNPLEAGLWQTISFEKGCYIGQETIARLNTYKGVKQQLWGLRLSAPSEPGTTVTAEEEKVGTLTSYVETSEGFFGLAYIRTKAGGAGLKVRVGNVDGVAIDLPFLSRGYLQDQEV
ncbi:MAG: folate-binding protein YgfZ [Oscillatoria sp. SIO1A7]|nr:folate-binding protein YgfZ [Oscillatoria sp. SIO1A7]